LFEPGGGIDREDERGREEGEGEVGSMGRRTRDFDFFRTSLLAERAVEVR
jgi:hypothetical protein